MRRVDAFLELVVNQGGSDLHLVSGETPRLRIHGELQNVHFRELSVEDMERILSEIMDESLAAKLDATRSVDFGHEVETLGRFRVNVHHHLKGLAATFRVISPEIPTMESLRLPVSVIEAVSHQSGGLFLVTGPSGCGKSTTLAAIVDRINSTRRGHIITIEDPIEFVHDYKKCVVTQRQVGLHSPTFAEALRNALREDPDVILVGDMRDRETISLALTAAETGVRVLASLHTLGATRTVDRIVNVFPSSRREQMRIMLADTLRMVVSQQLAQSTDGTSRIAVCEVLANTAGAASLIRAGKTHQLSSVIQSGTRSGMQSLDAQLEELVRSERIAGQEAYLRAVDKARFERHVAYHGVG